MAISILKKGWLLLLFFYLLVSNAANAQNLEEKAEAIFYNEDFEKALLIYREVLKQNPKNLKAQYHVEICSLLTDYPQKPLDKLIALGKTQSKEDKFYNYWLGRVLFEQYEFEKAILAWKKFLEIQKYKSKEIQEETGRFIKHAELAQAFYQSPERHHAQRLPDIINTEFSEITPTYIDNLNELLYASSADAASLGQSEHPFHVFSSFYDGTEWSKPELQSALGEYDENNVNLEIIGNDGRLLMFKPSKSGGLHESQLKHDSVWSQPHLFDLHIKKSRLKPHFYVNEQENMLIISAKSKGKQANLDLQYSQKISGQWTKPRPFGPTINTKGNEESAFLASDGKTLYFSSDGHSSIGGYDVFKSVYDSIADQWSAPENLGYPINTINNELYFKLKPNGKEGFFSSDRYHSTGGYDIYHFWEASYNVISGKVIDESSRQPIANAYIRFHPTKYLDTDFSASSNGQGIYETHIIPGDNYQLEVFLDNKLVYQKMVTITEKHDPSIVICQDVLVPHELNVLVPPKDNSLFSSSGHANDLSDHLNEEEPHNRPPIPREFSSVRSLGSKFRKGVKALIHNVYFETGSAVLTPEDRETLQPLVEMLQQYPEVRIEIAGHTDNVGPSEVNLKLSQKRSENVAKYLSSQKIRRSRLEAVGYGDTRPLASNDDEIGGRELNRRIEVIIIE